MWTGPNNEGTIVQVKNARKCEAITGLSIPQTANALQFRTKAKTLVATGYEKVQRDEDGVVRVYFKDVQVYERNLVNVEPEGSSLEKNPSPAKYNSKDVAKVEFLRPFSLPIPGLSGRWKAAAAHLYVDGMAVYES
jgi:hypothetical protein